jgi:hypothetical protein
VVAHGEARDVGADAADDAAALVAHDQRQRHAPVAAAHVQVGVADARGRDGHLDLAGPRGLQLDVLDLHGAVGPAQHHGPHAGIVPSAGAVVGSAGRRAACAARA